MYPIQIRAGGAHGFEVDLTTAIRLATGVDPNVHVVSVTAVHAEDTVIGRHHPGSTPKVMKAGEPLFGYEVKVLPRDIQYGRDVDAQVQIGGMASHSPEIGMIRAQCYLLACQIAAAANAIAEAVRQDHEGGR